MELKSIEKELDRILDYANFKDIRKMICEVDGRTLHIKDGKLKESELWVIKKLLLKAGIRAYEEKQKNEKILRRNGDDFQRKWQSRVSYRSWDITSLLRMYIALRGKNPDQHHSLKKWDGQEAFLT